jgi:protein-tyrosine phosphatase
MKPLLDAAPTFRDLGGLAIADGRHVRTGRLYRAGGLQQLAAGDCESLQRLGIRRVFDLRSELECRLHPSAWGDACGARVVQCDVNRDIRAGGHDLLDLLRGGRGEAGAREMMRRTYRGFGIAFAQQLPRLFAMLLADENLPALIHCTAGKDRTGFACAMLLHALGADEGTIVADYLDTAEFLGSDSILRATAQMLEAYLGEPPDGGVVKAVAGVRAEYIEAALDEIRRTHGSLERYLQLVGGLDPSRRARLQAMLLG